MVKEFNELYTLLLLLRKECAWDREQTLSSLSKHSIEEAYEVANAINEYTCNTSNEKKSELVAELKDELGDLLIQPLLLTVVANEEGLFSIEKVLKNAENKLIRRHPHVFDKDLPQDKQAIEKQWNKIKENENSAKEDQPKTETSKYDYLPPFIKARKTIKNYTHFKNKKIEKPENVSAQNIQQKLIELVKWAKANNIDLENELNKALKDCS